MIFDGDKAAIGPYLRELADLVGLRDWTINLSHDRTDQDDHLADVDVTYGRKVATIRFGKHWANDTMEGFRSTCVHELIHCHTKPMVFALNNAQEPLGTAAFSILEGAFNDAHEQAVDAIATEWAKTLPLPIKAPIKAPVKAPVKRKKGGK